MSRLHDAVSKIYWPMHLGRPDEKSGYLVGWNIRSFSVCVATVVSDAKVVDWKPDYDSFPKQS